MKTAFSDPRRRQKAMAKLNRTKQGTHSLDDFLNKFDRLLLEAEGWGWDDVIKKGYLKAAISVKLVEAMVGSREESSYEDYCAQLRMADDQLTELMDLTARRTSWGKKKWETREPPLTETTAPLVPVTQDKMDWESTTPGVSAARTKEPRWAEPAEIERRKRKRLCLRCGREGHMVRDCRTKLVQERKIQAAPTRSVPEIRIREETPSEAEESGKE